MVYLFNIIGLAMLFLCVYVSALVSFSNSFSP